MNIKLTVIISLYFINFLIAGLPGLMGAAIAHFALTAIEMRKIKRKIEFNEQLLKNNTILNHMNNVWNNRSDRVFYPEDDNEFRQEAWNEHYDDREAEQGRPENN